MPLKRKYIGCFQHSHSTYVPFVALYINPYTLHSPHIHSRDRDREMGISYFISFFLIVIFTLSSTHTAAFSSVSSQQLKFWSQNVQNHMPKTLLSKLSPLNTADSAYFASFPSTQSLFSNENFCYRANLSCSSRVSTIRPLGFGYNVYFNQQSRVGHVDPHTFFRASILKQGKTVNLPDLHDLYPHRSFLPYEIASKITVDSINLKQMLPQSIDETTKEAIQTTLLYCTVNTKGEIMSCPTSLEDTIKFSKSVLGKKNVFALISESIKGSQNEVKIGNIKQYEAETIVSCHEVYLPFAVYFCHMVPSTRLYNVDVVEPKTGAIVNSMLAVCHMDTSAWPANHVAFKILGSKPGGEACHWMTKVDLVWIGGDEKEMKRLLT